MPFEPRLLTSKGWVIPVAGGPATAEQRGAALDGSQAAGIVRELKLGSAWHALIALYEVATGRPREPRRPVRDHALVAAIEGALSSGRLLLVPEQSAGAAGGPRSRGLSEAAVSEEARLVAAVMGERRSLEFEGQRYRFVVLDRIPYRSTGTDDFRPVPPVQAVQLLARMAERLVRTPEKRGSWLDLAGKVTDGRAGVGVVMLRHQPAAPAEPPKRSDAPAVTPSQVRPKTAELDWVEIKIVYDDGSPFDGRCAIELPGGRKTSGSPGADGVIRFDGIDPGACKLSFPDLDADAWGPSGG